MARPGRGRRAYDRVAGTDEPAEEDLESQPPPNEVDSSVVEGESLTANSKAKTKGEDGERITIVVMDPAQNKFDISVDPKWNVGQLKNQGVGIHKIASSQQRLIFMGRLLNDDVLLKDAKINRDGIIIHLFPKPRVVVQGSNPEPSNDDAASTGSSHRGGGAHVPQIVLDPDEAQMRSQILVLGSAEIMDAQNNVKLLSFLLLIITCMELLALFTIILGVPQSATGETGIDDTVQVDDAIQHLDPGNVRTWRNSDYFDLALNLFGFYSAMLGIKATTENTRRIAFQYLVCTVICGVLWNAFYYYLNFQVERQADLDQHKDSENKDPMLTTQDYLVQAFFAILIPMMIWFLCCLRAYQFHQLLGDAEREAEARIQNEIRMVEEGNSSAGHQEDGANGVVA